jgi:hypothetical protein
MREFDRSGLKFKPLSERDSLLGLEIMINPDSAPEGLDGEARASILRVVDAIKRSRENGSEVVLAFGAHLVKNGLSRVVIEMIKRGYVSHILVNGAVAIHDWEFAYLGKTTESVKQYLDVGQFGLWEDTGKYLNRAINDGVKLGAGFGESLGRAICTNRINGENVDHRFAENSIFAQAYKSHIPISVCPGIGYDISNCHSECDGAALGKSTYRDFLYVAETLKNLNGGVIISVGSAIMAPMVIEKCLSMARNIALQDGKGIEDFDIFVNDLQKSDWDWSKGEPPMDNPAYYLRFNKSFSRMKGRLEYIGMDNRKFLHNVLNKL